MDDGDLRIGSAERDEALAALAEHHAAGRLDANDYEDRRGRATDAIVRRDLTSLFVDLPAPHPTVHAADVARAATGDAVQPSQPSSTSAKVARTVVSLSPFVAVALFFTTGRWWWFLLIPAVAVIARNFND